MRRPRLNTLPITLNTLLALLGALAVSGLALRLFEQAAADQALARAVAARDGAQTTVQHSGAALEAEARAWAADPALLDRLAAGDPATVEAYFIQALYQSGPLPCRSSAMVLPPTASNAASTVTVPFSDSAFSGFTDHCCTGLPLTVRATV